MTQDPTTTQPAPWLARARMLESVANPDGTRKGLYPIDLQRFQDADAAKLPPYLAEVADRYLKNFWAAASQGLAPAFLGRARTAKTYAAAHLLRRLSKVLRCKFVPVPDLLPGLERNRYADATRDTIRQIKDVSVLCLDDVFATGFASWSWSLVTEIVAARFNAMQPTIITGNIQLVRGKEREQLAELCGPMVARRLEDGSGDYLTLID